MAFCGFAKKKRKKAGFPEPSEGPVSERPRPAWDVMKCRRRWEFFERQLFLQAQPQRGKFMTGSGLAPRPGSLLKGPCETELAFAPTSCWTSSRTVSMETRELSPPDSSGGLATVSAFNWALVFLPDPVVLQPNNTRLVSKLARLRMRCFQPDSVRVVVGEGIIWACSLHRFSQNEPRVFDCSQNMNIQFEN